MGIGAGVVSILDWVKDKLPIQDRKERWKNELENLKKEEAELKKGKYDAKKGQRYAVVLGRIAYLKQLLINAAK